jgi:secondary thiamine-phosphate synthase enzyme
METLTLNTQAREAMVAITRPLQQLVADRGWKTGALLVFCPHTTGAITINENADPDVARDMTAFMGALVPQHSSFRHAEGNSDAHIKTSLFGPHCLVIVENGTLRLGTWQGIYFCEWDGPRTRTLWVQFLPGQEK